MLQVHMPTTTLDTRPVQPAALLPDGADVFTTSHHLALSYVKHTVPRAFTMPSRDKMMCISPGDVLLRLGSADVEMPGVIAHARCSSAELSATSRTSTRWFRVLSPKPTSKTRPDFPSAAWNRRNSARSTVSSPLRARPTPASWSCPIPRPHNGFADDRYRAPLYRPEL